ncbi:aromatic ring-opening dioxygenase LigA [Cellulomonas soli]|uniref:aromatic ring-opening dioxygenase LigA n=1 Tax=Cellulomonas soli TaxID=931535 RepID=UPI003F85FC7F
MNAAVQGKKGVAKLFGLLTIIAGVIFIVAGGITWGAVASNLKAEEITVSPDAKSFGGQLVDTPWEAFSQADIINHHALTATGDRTYAELGAEISALKEQLAADGASEDEIAEDADVAELTGLRQTVMNASFLRASLFTSVVAFGVAALVVGLGVVFLLIGWALRSLGATVEGGTVRVAEPEPATV